MLLFVKEGELYAKKQYVFDTTGNAYWNGIITGMALHPVANNSASGVVKISSIDLYGSGTVTTDVENAVKVRTGEEGYDALQDVE